VIIFLTGLVVGALLLSEQPRQTDPAASPEPVKGGYYTEALVGSLQRLNPLLDFYNAADRDVDRLLFSRLVRFDERGMPQPELATVWGVSQDGTVYNFELNPEAKWHDGQPVTAQDVVFTIEMMRSENDVVPLDLQEFWNEIEVVAPAEHALQFRLPEPFAPFLDYLSFGVLPEHLLGDKTFAEMVDADFNLQPVGSGPYRFSGLLAEEGQAKGIELVAFEDYFGQPPYIEQVIFRYYQDGASALQAYRAGLVQGITPVSTDILPAVLAEPDLSVYTGRRPELALVLFNLKDQEAAFLQEPEVRLALMQGLNRRYMVDKVMQGQAIIANGPIFPDTWAYYEGTPSVAFDREAAVQALTDAEYVLTEEGGNVRSKEGVEMRLKLIHPDTDQHRAIAAAIQSDWEQLGVAVELEALPYEDLVSDRLAGRSFQAALVDLNLARSPDPDPYPFWDQVQATGGQNYSQWDDRMASEYLEKARTATDIGERARYYRNFQVIFSQQMPALPLYYPVYTYAVSDSVGGVRMGPLFDTSDRFATVLDWYLASRPDTARTEATVEP
ncbi:MAG TPA: peptide ABC transporter substrate-binding protein, partial [Anaerolineaceae bacterium]|nr:peptide ABC transporter substrate-binding protein [Anaerolineaceae bacterium]